MRWKACGGTDRACGADESALLAAGVGKTAW